MNSRKLNTRSSIVLINSFQCFFSQKAPKFLGLIVQSSMLYPQVPSHQELRQTSFQSSVTYPTRSTRPRRPFSVIGNVSQVPERKICSFPRQIVLQVHGSRRSHCRSLPYRREVSSKVAQRGPVGPLPAESGPDRGETGFARGVHGRSLGEDLNFTAKSGSSSSFSPRAPFSSD